MLSLAEFSFTGYSLCPHHDIPFMNIVYVHTHDAGRYIQPYGYAVSTPHLQAFAESGMLFRQAFCANPTCSPSRACLLTGQYAHVNGMLGLAHRGFRLDSYEGTMVKYLGDAGWHTALSGVQHIAKPPAATVDEIGYHEVLCESSIDSNNVASSAEAFLAREHEKPFFLDVGFFPPHRIGQGEFPTEMPVPSAKYVRPPAHLPDTPETRADFAAYLSSVSTFDHMFGRVIAALDANGLAEDTLVIATTDHGIAFPDMKCRLTDHGLGVMLILRGPKGFCGGQVSDAMVSHLDLFPTVCDMLELELPERLAGKSLCPLAQDPEQSLHECLFAEVNVHAAYEPMRSVRTDRWKYIRHYNRLEHRVLPNCDDGLTKSYLCDHQWETHVPGEEELYDLIMDPQEACNLAGQDAYAGELKPMRDRLENWMRETDDPFLREGLDLQDKIVTPSDTYSPSGAARSDA